MPASNPVQSPDGRTDSAERHGIADFGMVDAGDLKEPSRLAVVPGLLRSPLALMADDAGREGWVQATGERLGNHERTDVKGTGDCGLYNARRDAFRRGSANDVTYPPEAQNNENCENS